MRKHHTPAKRLRHDQDRKRRQRERLRCLGLRPRQIWATDKAWGALQPLLSQVGIRRASQAQARDSDPVPTGALAAIEQGVL